MFNDGEYIRNWIADDCNESLMFSATSEGLFRSSDEGRNWNRVDSISGYYTGHFIDYTTHNFYYATRNCIYVSNNNGTEFTSYYETPDTEIQSFSGGRGESGVRLAYLENKYSSELDWIPRVAPVNFSAEYIASGRLDLIQDEELRIRLASWAGLNLDLAHDEMRTVDLRDKIAEYIAREFPKYFSESQDSICPVLLGDETFRGLLSLRAGEIFEVTTDNDEIPKSIEEILAATDPATL